MIYLLRESGSLQSGFIHSCSSLHNKVWRRVYRLISSWLLIRQGALRRSLVLSASCWTPLPFSISMVLDVSVLCFARRSFTRLITVGGSSVNVPQTSASPAILSALSSPWTLERPGQNTHTNLWRVLSVIAFRGSCGLLVSVLAYHAGDPSSIPSSLARIFGRWLDWCHSD